MVLKNGELVNVSNNINMNLTQVLKIVNIKQLEDSKNLKCYVENQDISLIL